MFLSNLPHSKFMFCHLHLLNKNMGEKFNSHKRCHLQNYHLPSCQLLEYCLQIQLQHCQYVLTRCTKLKGFRWPHNKYLSYLFKCRCYYYSVCSRDPCNIQKVWKQNNINHKFRSLHGIPVADHIKNLLECRHS